MNNQTFIDKLDQNLATFENEVALKVVLENLDDQAKKQFFKLLMDDKQGQAIDFLKSNIPNLDTIYYQEFTKQSKQIGKSTQQKIK